MPEIDLWLDPPQPQQQAFVSHAHADHFARHQRVLCSEATAGLLRHRYRVAPERLDVLSFHTPVIRDGFRLRLLPAGHILGSAMLHLTRLADGASLLYTGDFKNRRGRVAEPVHFVTADLLVIETTFGLPRFVFPPQLEVEMAVLRFVNAALHDQATPVLLAYSLGKAQEALALLHEHSIPVVVHPSVAAMTTACREAGANLPDPPVLDGQPPPGHALIAPPNALRALLTLKPKRVAVLTGWALDPDARFRYQADEVIPFSDHADHAGLLECIQRVRPKHVLTIHGFAREFAAELRGRGIDAWSAAGHDQLELAIHQPASQQSHSPAVTRHNRPICPLADFSDLCRLVAETHSRVSQTGFVARYLQGLESDTDLRLACRWLAGPTLPAADRLGASPTATAAILRRALLALPGTRDDRLREILRARHHPARSVRLVLQQLSLKPEAADLSDIAAFLESFATARGALARAALLAAILPKLHPAEGETVVRLLAVDPADGLPAGLLEDALAAAFEADPDAVRHAFLLTGDAGETAVLARYGRLDEAAVRPFSPVPPMPVASLPPGSPATLPHEPPWWLEPLCPGLRAQLHKQADCARLFDRHLKPLDPAFPAILRAAAAMPRDFLLDGMLCTGSRDHPLPLPKAANLTIQKQVDLFAAAPNHPADDAARFIAFDILWLDGHDLTALSLEERRARLLSLHLADPFDTIPVARPTDPPQVALALEHALASGCDGIVAKDPASAYAPARRSQAWLAIR